MEQLPEVCERPYDPRLRVAVTDEQPKQLISVRRPIPAAPSRPGRVDYEYVRERPSVAWMFVEPLAGWRDVRVTDTRTVADWAHQVRSLVDDPRCAEAERITLACDNLNTHALASLYQALVWDERRNTRQVGIEWQFTTEDAQFNLKCISSTSILSMPREVCSELSSLGEPPKEG
jgi:hypothetical protein